MLAYMRYRHISYEFMLGDQSTSLGLPKPKVELLPTFYLPNDDAEIEAVVDSTPPIRRFEQAFSGRETIPPNPALGFINYLIEDYAADIKKAGSILPLWRGLQMDSEQHQKLSTFVAERQISGLDVVGSNDVTAPVIEAS